MSLDHPYRHALPVNDSLFTEPLYLTHVGWERVGPREAYPWGSNPPFFDFKWEEGRTLPEFCLALNISGEGEYQTRKARGYIHPGDAFLFRPGEWHRHRPLPEIGWTLMWIHFNGDTAIRWMKEEAFQLRDNFAVIENPELFRAQFEHLIKTADREGSANSKNFGHQAIGLLSHFIDEDRKKTEVDNSALKKDEITQAVVDYIWNFSHGIVDVPAVAARVGIPRRTLDRHFRATTGRSVLDEIQLCRITRAAKLLKETNIHIKHVVYRAGFRNEEHLRVAFHKSYGASPKEYREEFRK